MTAEAPVITTRRLCLRGHDVGDLPAMAAMWSDPLVVRHIGGQPSDRARTEARLGRYLAMWPGHGHGYWALEDRETADFLGEIGFARFGRGLGPDFDDWPEAGWVLARGAQGRGLASEALSAVLDWADGTLPARRTVCMIAPGNAASLRLAARFGFAAFDERAHPGGRVRLMARPRGEIPPRG
ncbi:GNAT family N-acetyltransferase [Roseibacterium sp. SDUM158017]|uniref:GNAT family N-acetyltransferase n=1 Tax=Roseicyclus salinarum TaxID=3036773 RepID=UPI002414F77A|nr:GNAT family N-acetyltransferase [Roseibacterium sp. SDUM158017]MDG4647443.1 GNAT family N-acetyltransferase [Roseibacterium sp. SDUM158017]